MVKAKIENIAIYFFLLIQIGRQESLGKDRSFWLFTSKGQLTITKPLHNNLLFK